MKTALNQNLRGMQRAAAQIELASSRVARWGLDTNPAEVGGEGIIPADEVRLDGVARPRNVLNQRWGGRGPDGLSPEVDLSEEALRMKTGEWAFRANIAATRSVLDLQKTASEIFEPKRRN